jgi:hypothetical protein
VSELRDAALYYARWRGWAVFPVRPRAKEPLVGGAYKAATADLEQVETWWRQYPDANIGLATGERSGVWVLDVDGPEGFASFDALEAEHGEVPDTQWVSTGKGSHVYWACPAGHDPGRRIGVRPGLDFIGGAGYLILPPSIHPSGRPYAWAEVDVPIAVAPDWLRTLERPRVERPRTGPASWPRMPAAAQEAPTGAVRDKEAYLAGVVRRAVEDVRGAGQGQRNVQLFRSAVWVVSVATGLGRDLSAPMGDLWRAGQLAGLEDLEIQRTLESAIERGRRNPAEVSG